MVIDPKIRAAQDERLKLIGSICDQWSFVEYMLLRSMRKLCGFTDDEIGKILFGGLDMRPRVAMAIELARHFKAPAPFVTALIATRDAIDGGLLKRRNRAIHGVQFLYSDGELRVEVHRGKDRQRRELSAKDLWNLSNDIHEAGIALCTTINHYLWNMEPPPYTLLEKPVQQSRKRKAPKQGQKMTPREPRQKASAD